MRKILGLLCCLALVGAACGGDDSGSDSDSGDSASVVEGYLFQEGTDLVLCSAIRESFPPQCGGDMTMLEDPDGVLVDTLADAPSDQGITWTDGVIAVTGQLNGDTLVVQSVNGP